MFEGETEQPKEPRKFRTEAERVAATRPRCDYCGDDTPQLFRVRVKAYDVEGRRMTGKRICDMCITGQGFTGWAYARGGWPMRDPLGRAHPPEFETEAPTTWEEIGAALEGRLRVFS